MSSDFIFAASRAAIFCGGKSLAKQTEDFEDKKSRNHSRGSEGGRKQARLFPSSGFWRNRCLHHKTQDLMSVNKQVFWLRGRSTPSALPIAKISGLMTFRRSLQRRYRMGFAPTSLFSPAVAWGTCSHYSLQRI